MLEITELAGCVLHADIADKCQVTELQVKWIDSYTEDSPILRAVRA